jgi:hypothetical protein
MSEYEGKAARGELQACAEHMRALGWYESHLFGHYYLSPPLDVAETLLEMRTYAVAFVDVDHWTLGSRIKPGEYAITHSGNTLAALKDALATIEQAKGAEA